MTIEAWINPVDATNQYPIVEWSAWNDGLDWGPHLWINVEFGGVGGPGCLWVNLRDIAGVFAVGFDVHPRSEPRNDVSVHWNGVEHANVTMADANVNLTSGSFHRATLTLRHANGGALVTVSFVRDVNGAPSPAYTPIRDLFVPGLNPFSSRVEFAGRSGALDMNLDLDNILVQFLPPCRTDP